MYVPQLIRSNLNAIFTVNEDTGIDKSKEKVTTILEEWSLGLMKSSKSLEQLENDVKTIDNKEKAPTAEAIALAKEIMKIKKM